MAEHVRNELARAGAAVRPGRVITLAHFLEGIATGVGTASAPLRHRLNAALLHRLIQQALARRDQPRFRAVAQYRGFHEALAALMDEAPMDSVDQDLAVLFQDVQRALGERGLALRNQRLEAAAKIAFETPAHVVLDGFFAFSPAELALLQNMAARTAVTVTLPDWTGGAKARGFLLKLGFVEQHWGATRR